MILQSRVGKVVNQDLLETSELRSEGVKTLRVENVLMDRSSGNLGPLSMAFSHRDSREFIHQQSSPVINTGKKGTVRYEGREMAEVIPMINADLSRQVFSFYGRKSHFQGLYFYAFPTSLFILFSNLYCEVPLKK